MFNLTTKARKLDLHVDMQCEMFDQLLMPIMLYGSEIPCAKASWEILRTRT